VGECFFWYWLNRGVPDKIQRAVKRLCVCVCVCLCTLSDLIKRSNTIDNYQFGFRKDHSTSMCMHVFKIIDSMAVMFSLVSLTSIKLLIMLIMCLLHGIVDNACVCADILIFKKV